MATIVRYVYRSTGAPEMGSSPEERGRRWRQYRGMFSRPAPTLFITQFAAMAGFLAPVPVLPRIAEDLGVSIAAAGQLRTLSGLAAGVAALGAGVLAHRLGVRRLLLAGLCLIVFGSAMSALAPSFVVLAAAQPPLGAGIAMVLAGGWSAAAAWAPATGRARLLAWAIVGQPAAWVVGMPVIGLVTAGSWRWAWVAVPLVSAVCGGVAVARRPPDTPGSSPARSPARALYRAPNVAAWALSELLTYSAWGAVLVYTGALLLESYQLAPDHAGMMLGAAAAGFLPGTFLARRWAERHMGPMLVCFGIAAAGTVIVFMTARPSPAGSTVLLAALMALIGARTMAAGAFDLHAPLDRRAALMGIRAAAMQFGNLAGAAAGGVAIATGGYRALGFMTAALFALAVAPHVWRPRAAPHGRWAAAAAAA
jgi:MFS transporter, DHA1 family, inner membrane transport protein